MIRVSLVAAVALWAGALMGIACKAHTPRRTSKATRSRRAPASDATLPGHTLSIATYNINFGNGHSDATVEMIASLDTDIILLQETTVQSESSVRQRLSDRYREIRFEHCCGAGGLGILSRFEILDAELIPTKVGFFPAWWLRVQTPDGPVVVVDVHLRPPISDKGSWVVGFFSTRDAREREIAGLWDQLPQGDPIIVAGDFNENANGRVVGFLQSKGLDSALPVLSGRETTWHWKLGASTLRMQLDHLAHGPAFVPVSARVARGGASDHEPVVVELSRKKDRADRLVR